MSWDHLPKPAKGAGRGGPAKGAGVGPAQPFTADSPTRQTEPVETMHALNGDPDEQVYRAEQRRLKRERRRQAWEALDEMVKDKAHPSHFNAAKETLNRIDGMPVQKNEHSGADGVPLFNAIQVSFVKPRNDAES